jgi:uncharacterized protein YbjT (DUF2867 family)
MRVILFGATGMIGGGVLRECLLDPEVEVVLAVGRAKLERTHEKLEQLVLPDLTDYRAVAAQLAGFDACFYCLGITSAGMSEDAYRRVTYDITAAAARAIAEASPTMTFIFVSGAGTDPSSKTMWARVKGAAENAVLGLPFRAKYVFRPAFVATSRTRSYRILYAIAWPLVPLIAAIAPRHVTTTERVGRAMLNVARRGFDKTILENDDINRAAGV